MYRHDNMLNVLNKTLTLLMLFLFPFLDEADRKCEYPNVAFIEFLLGSTLCS